MGNKNVTLKAIADEAGVSITTVSHVLNDTRYVKTETRNAVLKALEDLHYTVEKQKSSAKEADRIGLILANITEDYFISIIKVIQSYADKHDISIIICDSGNDSDIELKNIKSMLACNVGGLILAPVDSERYPIELAATSVPVILIDRQYNNHKHIFIGINNFRSGFLATKNLVDGGCKRIGFIGYSDSIYTIKERAMGYLSCIVELNSEQRLPYKLQLQYTNKDAGQQIISFISDNNLDGLVCATSDLCYQVISCLDELQSTMLNSLKIITYDDNKWLDYLKYPVSVVTQPTAEIGLCAIEQLVQLISEPETKSRAGNEIFFNTDFIHRI